MAIKISSLKVDTSKQDLGDWIEYNGWPEPVKFHVRGSDYKPYKTAMSEAFKPLLAKYKKFDRIPELERYRVEGEVIAEHLLLGWDDGIDVKYDNVFGKSVMTDIEYKKVRSAIEFCVMQVGEREVEYIEEAAKNSVALSATS